MKKYMKRESLFMRQYYDIFLNQKSMSNYVDYYKALAIFVKRNNRFFTDDILATYNLDILIELAPEKYPSSYSEAQLEWERKRGSEDTYSNISSLAASISYRLWDVIAIYSGKECPITGEYNMRYVIVQTSSEEELLVEECEQCGCLLDQTGGRYIGEVEALIPAERAQVFELKGE